MKLYESWGRFPRVEHANIIRLNWSTEKVDFGPSAQLLLPFGYGRSYGDSCLNDGGTLLDTTGLSRFMRFDERLGVLRCEAGVSLGEILNLVVPRGWFVPVTPGTKHVTIGGAIANDVHGKNHHAVGTFGCHVNQFELLRSSGQRLLCSPNENVDLYKATIGGLGLTGLVVWAEVQLKRISSPLIEVEKTRFGDLSEFVDMAASSDQSNHYTVAWIDCLATGRRIGRGIFMRGNHLEVDRVSPKCAAQTRRRTISLPCSVPNVLLNRITIRGFNWAYYRRQFAKHVSKIVDYDSFFYPLDSVTHWNRLYGSRGFLQYQCVIPNRENARIIREILYRISVSKKGSFLSVLKMFGNRRSPGMLSFPRPGITLALDFPNDGKHTFELLDELDEIVGAAGGAVYPAKDARMSAESFQRFFPNWKEFAHFVDPRFSSTFWRRVTERGKRASD